LRQEAKASRALVLAFALVFLFETWIWGSVVSVVGWIARRIPWSEFKEAVRRRVNRLPPIVALLLFGVPLAFNEFGSLGCVILMATGRLLVGAIGYVVMKVVGLGLVAVIFDLTREQLMTLPWFVVVYDRFRAFHEFARRLVAPYREAAVVSLMGMRDRARASWARLGLWREARAVEAERGE
jgi:hypothetical protein